MYAVYNCSVLSHLVMGIPTPSLYTAVPSSMKDTTREIKWGKKG